jgi:hypothetical protein
MPHVLHSGKSSIFQNQLSDSFFDSARGQWQTCVAMPTRKKFREDDEALALYLDNVTDLVARQLAESGDKLPTFFVLPTPTNAEHLENARNILTDFCICEFAAELPPLVFQDGGSA